MARKILSGVLAFTMIFGATAPMAMADETGVEQYALLDYALSESSYEFTVGNTTPKMFTMMDAKNDSTVNVTVAANSEKLSVTTGEQLMKDGYLVVTPAADIPAGDYKVVITITNSGETFTREIAIKAKSATGDITYEDLVLDHDLAVAAGTTNSLKLTQKGTVAYDGSTVYYDVKITNVEVKTAAKDYLDATYNGNVITVTGKKATAAIEDALRVTCVNAAGATKTVLVDVEVTAQKDVNYKWVAKDDSVKADKTGYYLLQAYRLGEYGEEVEYDVGQSVDWYINGNKVEPDDTIEKNGVVIAKLVKHKDYKNKFTARGVEFYLPGTYTIGVSAANSDSIVASTTVTVGLADADESAFTIETSGIQLGREYNLADITNWRISTKMNNGVTYSFVDPGRTINSAHKAGKDVVNPAYTITAALDAALKSDIDAFQQYITIENGTIKVANNAETVKAAKAGKQLKVTFKVPGVDDIVRYLPLQEFAKLDYVVEVYDGATKLNDKILVMKAGETKQLTYKVIDKVSGNVLGNEQIVVWDMEDANNNQNVKDFVAVVDQNGLVTAQTAGKTTLKVYAIDNKDGVATVTIFVTGTAPEKPEEEKPEETVVRGYVNTTSGNLNVRAGAGTNFDKVGQVTKNTPVIILSEKDGWYNIEWNGAQTGWVKASYIVVTEGEVEKPETPAEVTAVVTASSLKVRKTAGGTQIGSLKKGTEVVVLEKGANWTKIEYGTGAAYVSTAYLAF